MNSQYQDRQPSRPDRDAIAVGWANGLDSDQISIALNLAQATVCRVLEEQQDRRRFARKMGMSV